MSHTQEKKQSVITISEGPQIMNLRNISQRLLYVHRTKGKHELKESMLQ